MPVGTKKIFSAVFLLTILLPISWPTHSFAQSGSISTTPSQPLPICPGVVSVVSGPISGGSPTAGYEYTFHGDIFKDLTDASCVWEIQGVERTDQPCKNFTQVVTGTGPVEVKLVVGMGDKKCTVGEKQNLIKKPSEMHQVIRRQLEVNYPILKDQDGKEVTITPATTPAQLIRYVFILALSAIGLIALISIIVSGAQWLAGGADKARKRLGGVLIGGVLLLSTYVFLNFLNPELLVIKDPKLPVIDIEVPEISIGVLKMCQEAKNNNTKLQCADFDGRGSNTCLDITAENFCAKVIEDGPCYFSSRQIGGFINVHGIGDSDCKSAKDLCPRVKKCEDYSSVFLNDGFLFIYGTLDAEAACEHNICRGAPGAPNDCVVDQNLWSAQDQCVSAASR